MDTNKNLFHPVGLPGFTIPGNLFLAPLAGISDRSFRRICLEHGAPFTFTEMISGEALARGNGKTIELLRPAEGEEQLGVQVFLSNPDQATRALEPILQSKPSLIDLNCGCPVPKVVKTGAGAALMRNPEKIREIVAALVGGTDIPVSVKLRTGWDHNELTYLEAAEAAIKAGAVMVTLHGRTRSQGYSGYADWSCIKNLVNAVSVPVIGNGDAFTAEATVRMLKETGCAGVMFARGAMGNPRLFSDAIALMTRGILPPPPSVTAVMETALRHLRYAVEDKGELAACREMRKQMAYYTKGLPGSALLRSTLVQCNTVEEYEKTIAAYLALSP
jgi:tRNA-dihydrouridine synthase B